MENDLDRPNELILRAATYWCLCYRRFDSFEERAVRNIFLLMETNHLRKKRFAMAQNFREMKFVTGVCLK
jgi:hypothetical protein